MVFNSCKKDPIIINDPEIALRFSNDSIVFDTVFTTIGSITKQLKVYNRFDHKIKISSIELMGGQASAYRLNIDGTPSLKVNDVELEGGDSLYIFIKVLIDPNDENSPFVVHDQINFTISGFSHLIDLVAWGQNANYIIADKYIEGLPPFSIVAGENENVSWTSSKPYLIYGYAVVDSGAVLQIEEGTKIHFHNNSGLWVYKGGSLKVNGSLEKPVVFEGDRLDEDYRDIAGQWDRIWINEGSEDNVINYAIIKNGFIGLQVETIGNQLDNRLVLNNTRITNMSGTGILARNYDIEASNNLITNCGINLMALTMGGKYHFIHSTFANYWNASVRQGPSIYINNFESDENGSISGLALDTYFGNCIIDGRKNEELLLELIDEQLPKIVFDHSALKANQNLEANGQFIQCIWNPESLFRDIEELDFQLDTLSPAIDIGSPVIAIKSPFDILGVSRTQNPDLGAFEFVLNLSPK